MWQRSHNLSIFWIIPGRLRSKISKIDPQAEYIPNIPSTPKIRIRGSNTTPSLDIADQISTIMIVARRPPDVATLGGNDFETPNKDSPKIRIRRKSRPPCEKTRK